MKEEKQFGKEGNYLRNLLSFKFKQTFEKREEIAEGPEGRNFLIWGVTAHNNLPSTDVDHSGFGHY